MIAIGICEDSPEDLRRLQEALERLVPEVCGEPARCTAYRCGEALLADLDQRVLRVKQRRQEEKAHRNNLKHGKK